MGWDRAACLRLQVGKDAVNTRLRRPLWLRAGGAAELSLERSSERVPSGPGKDVPTAFCLQGETFDSGACTAWFLFLKVYSGS